MTKKHFLQHWTILAISLLLAITACKNGQDIPDPQQKPSPVLETTFEWASCDVIFREGHTHGVALHGNPLIKGNPFPIIQEFSLRNENGKIHFTPGKGMTKDEVNRGNRDYLIARAVSGIEIVYGMELHFKDKNDKPIGGQLIEKEFLPYHQIFFSVADKNTDGQSYAPLDNRTGKPITQGGWDKKNREQRIKDSENFFTYTYRDTDPWDRMIAPDWAGQKGVNLLRRNYGFRVADPKDYVGLKGYFSFRAFPKTGHKPSDNHDGALPSFFINLTLAKAPNNQAKYSAPGVSIFNGKELEGKNGPVAFNQYPSNWHTILSANIPIQVIADMNDQYVNAERYYEDMAKATKRTVQEMKDYLENAQSEDNSDYHM